MKNITFQRLLTLSVFYLFFFTATVSAQNGESTFPAPQIHIGKAKVTGRIIDYHPADKNSRIAVSILFVNIISEEETKLEKIVNEDGQFFFDVPIERNFAFVSLNLASDKYDYGWHIIGLNQGNVLNIEINLVDSTSFKLRTTGGMNITNTEMEDAIPAYRKFDTINTWAEYYKMNPEEYLNETLQRDLKKRIQTAIDSLSFSSRVKQFIITDFNCEYIKGRVLRYKATVEESAEFAQYSPYYCLFSAIEPDVSYYDFFKSLNLNNPQYLYCFQFSKLIRRFLSVPAFKIRIIRDEDVDVWLDDVKSRTKGILGFDKGLFYDLLAAKAYAIQLSDSSMPFSEIQKKNIQIYFGKNNGELLKVLMEAHENLLQNISKDLHVRENPKVPNETLMDSITERYKGHVTLVDFWATWCAPCLRAHSEMEQIKALLKEKGVEFVYFTDEGSPKLIWRKKIDRIGGDHYYFSKSQWKYLMDRFGFEGVPSYLIYDKQGVVVRKFTGFIGVTKMKEILLKQLNK